MANQDFYDYDPSEVTLIVGGVPISGYSSGTFIEVEFDSDQFTKDTGISGTQRSKTNNYDGVIKATLMNGSGSNDHLSGLWNADRYTGGGVVPALLRDRSGTTLGQPAKVWVRKMPTNGFGNNKTDREWLLDAVNLRGMAGGNVANDT